MKAKNKYVIRNLKFAIEKMSEQNFKEKYPAAFPKLDDGPLPTEIETDKKGFVKTGMAVAGSSLWTLRR